MQRYIGLGKAYKNSLGKVRDIYYAEHHGPIRANGFHLSGNFYAVVVIPDEKDEDYRSISSGLITVVGT